LGYSALYNNTAASNNTAVGYQAMYSNTTGDRNIGIGATAMYHTTTGQGSIAIGYQALIQASTGDDNVAIGSDSPTANAALESLTTGVKNVSVGNNSGVGVTTAGFNTFLGFGAGEQGNKSESVLIGYNAGRLVTANQSTFVGSEAGKNITTGAKNTILGRYNGNQGGLDIRTSSNNIVLSDGDGTPQIHAKQVGSAQWTYFGNLNSSFSLPTVTSGTGATVRNVEVSYVTGASFNSAWMTIRGDCYQTTGSTKKIRFIFSRAVNSITLSLWYKGAGEYPSDFIKDYRARLATANSDGATYTSHNSGGFDQSNAGSWTNVSNGTSDIYWDTESILAHQGAQFFELKLLLVNAGSSVPSDIEVTYA
jgi:hypothetical protein